MSDEEEEETVPFVPFKEREEWKDVVPIPQDDGPDPVCLIAYPSEFSQTMDYFRAVLQKDELSPRALKLTEEVLSMNAANYTVWSFRRKILSALKSDLRKELEYLTEVGRRNEKNYQVWYHRKFLVEELKDPSEELSYTAEMIRKDTKNYHAWAHRQWVVEAFDLWHQELDFIDALLREDLRNNSAWNQRYFVITRKNTSSFPQEVLEREAKYAIDFIQKAPNNESPWIYLKGLFKGRSFSEYPPLLPTLLQFKDRFPACPHVLATLVVVYEKEDKEKALPLLEELETKTDVLHKKYWAYKKQKLMTS